MIKMYPVKHWNDDTKIIGHIPFHMVVQEDKAKAFLLYADITNCDLIAATRFMEEMIKSLNNHMIALWVEDVIEGTTLLKNFFCKATLYCFADEEDARLFTGIDHLFR